MSTAMYEAAREKVEIANLKAKELSEISDIAGEGMQPKVIELEKGNGTRMRICVRDGVGAGTGGTAWGWIEGFRAASESRRAIGATFRDWGIPTADSVVAQSLNHG